MKYRHFLETPRANKQLRDARVSFALDRFRAKRSATLSTGVKLCPQESMAEVITSHKAYYKLRGNPISTLKTTRDLTLSISAKFGYYNSHPHKSQLTSPVVCRLLRKERSSQAKKKKW